MSKRYLSSDDQGAIIGMFLLGCMFILCPTIGIITMIYKGFLVGLGVSVLSIPIVCVCALIVIGAYLQHFFHS